MAQRLTTSLQVRDSAMTGSRPRCSLSSYFTDWICATSTCSAPLLQNLQRLSQHARLMQKLGERKMAFLQEAFPGLGETSDEDESDSDAEWESEEGEDDSADEQSAGDAKMVGDPFEALRCALSLTQGAVHCTCSYRHDLALILRLLLGPVDLSGPTSSWSDRRVHCSRSKADVYQLHAQQCM